MRNLAEQKKVTVPIIWTLVMIVVYALFFIVFFGNYFSIDASLLNFRTFDFMEETRTFAYDDIDEGEFMRSVEKGSKVILKVYNSEIDELEKNDIFTYYVTHNTVDTILTQVFISSTQDANGQTLYTSHAIDDMTESTYTINSGKILGKWVFPIPYLGYVTYYLTYFPWLSYASLILLAFIMIGIPIVVAIHRARMKKAGSPFPEGVNIHRLAPQNLYIYQNIKTFLQDAGMNIDKGYDCDLVYIGRYLFGILHCTNGHIYFNVNKNFQRYDNKIDRSGYICIPHAASIEKTKKRINSMYRAYFADVARINKMEQMAKIRKTRPRPLQ